MSLVESHNGHYEGTLVAVGGFYSPCTNFFEAGSSVQSLSFRPGLSISRKSPLTRLGYSPVHQLSADSHFLPAKVNTENV